jgi:hypothetical protein
VMQTCCSFKSAIFWVWRNPKWNKTHLYLTRQYWTVTCATTLIQAGNHLLRIPYLLHLVVEKCASSSSVVSRLFDRTFYISFIRILISRIVNFICWKCRPFPNLLD